MSAGQVVSDFFADDGSDRPVMVYDTDSDVPRLVSLAEARAGLARFAESLEPGSAVRGAWEDMALNGMFGVVLVTDEMAALLENGEPA